MTEDSAPRPAAADEDLSGRQLGDYRILRRLGRGGMAVVYQAEQISLRRQVAFKVLRSDLARQPENVQRFHREAQSAAALVHAHIVQIYEVGCLDGVHFIAQEYLAGGNLRERIRRSGSLPVGEGVRILAQVAAALGLAAEQGVIHRDIKPENILLSKSGEAKVADFGLARVRDRSEQLRLTTDGMTLGTPLYMSPEQLEGGELDPRCDQYSLGVTAYEMFAGQPPFVAETLAGVAFKHVHTPPPVLREVRPDVPAELSGIVQRLLEKKPEQRYESGAELLAELSRLPVEGGEAGRTTGWNLAVTRAELPAGGAGEAATGRLSRAMREERAGRLRRVWWWAAVTGLMLVAAVSGGVLAWVRHPPLGSTRGRSGAAERMPSAREQYYYAALDGGELAWKSVGQYFPAAESAQNAYYVRRSQQRLAELYREQGRAEESLRLYQQLAELPLSVPEFRAVGLAGMAALHADAGRRGKAVECLAQLRPLLGQLDPAVRRALLEQLGDELRDELSAGGRNPRRPPFGGPRPPIRPPIE